jgi:hypothetical protein
LGGYNHRRMVCETGEIPAADRAPEGAPTGMSIDPFDQRWDAASAHGNSASNAHIRDPRCPGGARFTMPRNEGPAPVAAEGTLAPAREGYHRELGERSTFLPTGSLNRDGNMQRLLCEQQDAPDASQMTPDERLGWMADHGLAPNLVPDRHAELMRTEVPPEARGSLEALGQDVHNPYELGSGNYNIDEYSVILDQLPDGASPEAFLEGFLRSPNQTADDGLFDFANEFHARQEGSAAPWSSDWHGPSSRANWPMGGQEGFSDGEQRQPPGIVLDPDHPVHQGQRAPDVGDWYHIDIPGNDGDVMIVDREADDDRTSATVQTMTDDQFGPVANHPVSGRRQFGVETLPEEEGYRFYTRAFDRATSGAMDNPVTRAAQHADWSALMGSVAEQHGGRPEHVDDEGRDVWGWHQHVPAEHLLASGVD